MNDNMIHTMSQYTLLSSLNNSNNNKNSNIFWNTFIFLIVGTLFSFLTQNLKDVKLQNIFDFFNKYNCFCKRCVSLEFTAKEVEGTRFTGPIWVYSEGCKAIFHYIKKYIPKKYKNIISKEKEIIMTKITGCYFDELQEDNQGEINYRIEYFNSFNLTDKIYCKFTLSSDFQNILRNGKEREVRRKIYLIEIFSYSLTLDNLREFVQKYSDKYNDYLHKKTINGQKYFSYEGIIKSEDCNRGIWNEYSFLTTKNWNNIFINNKQHLRKNLEQIKNSSEFHNICGKPDEIKILIHGNDFGVGKTSLAKVICAEVFPNRHVVNIPLSKIKTNKEFEDVLNPSKINGKSFKINELIFLFEEIDKIDVLKANNDKHDLEVKIKTKLLNLLEDEENKEKNSKKKKELEEFLESNSMLDMNFKNCKKIHDELDIGFILSLLDGPIEFPGRVIIFYL